MALRSSWLVGCWLLGCAGARGVPPPQEPSVEARLRGGGWALLDVQVRSKGAASLATVEELSFAGADGSRVTATRVRPQGPGPFAGVLWVHWLGDAATSNHTEFLSEAVELAQHGVVSLLVDALWSAPGWYQARIPEADFAASIAQAKSLVRALSLLSAEPGVDGARLGVVGHDYGAMHAILAGAVEHRPRAWVLVTATPHFSDWAFYGPKPKDAQAYRVTMARLDPVAFIGQLTGAVLLQFAAHDAYVPPSAATALAAAAPPGHTVRSYDTDHSLNVPQARAERLAFLRGALLLP
jgi:dienelactone hydrolase